MSTLEPIPVSTFNLTVVCAQGTFNPLFPTYVVVEIGDQHQKTKTRHGVKKIVWNETWSFAVTAHIRFPGIKIQLYRVIPLKDDILLGEFEEGSLASAPSNTDIVKSLKNGGKQCEYNVTFRVGDTPFRRTFSDRIEALLIGVDKYPALPHLRGCVNDAVAMEDFLSKRLRVPDEQIKKFHNKLATRKAILSYLETGFTRADCDIIIIFFAGHGSRIDAPAGYPSADRKIETICSYDTGVEDPDTDGATICGIEDFRFNILLHKLAARKKSNNITVILDSCHSAGASRGDDDIDGIRGVETTGSIPMDWKEVMSVFPRSTDGRAAAVPIPIGFRYDYLASHVLLAACGQDEKAREVTEFESTSTKPRGRFTVELLKHLYEISVDKLTNEELIGKLLGWPDQRPQCVGTHSRRLLFDGKIVVPNISSYALTVTDRGLEVQIGTVHGVVIGTEFTALHSDRPVLVAESVTAYSSLLAPRVDYTFKPQTRVIVSNWKNQAVILKVFLASHSRAFRCLKDDLPVLVSPGSMSKSESDPTPRSARKFIFVDSLEKGDIELTTTRSDKTTTEFVIKRVDPLTSLVDPSRTDFKLDVSVESQHLPHILNRVSHFHFYLKNRNSAEPFKHQIGVKMFDLATMEENVPKNLFTDNPWEKTRPTIDSHAHIIEDRTKRYGFLLSNCSAYNIFPYLFYFDPRGYQIKVWYTPNEPIKAQKGPSPTELTLGYGAGGGFPFEFTVPTIPNISSDTGFLKLFVSTERISFLDDIGQLNPLQPQEADRIGNQFAPMSGLWDAWIATITVERREVAEDKQRRIILSKKRAGREE